MERLKSTWKRVPNSPRRILTFILGMLLVLVAPLLGAIPGPGGMVIFLLGIAVLATEFVWAERLRDYLLELLRHAGAYIRRHPRLSAVMLTISLIVVATCAYIFYTQII